MERYSRLLAFLAFFALVLAPAIAEARRSGSSFGGRQGFRSAPSSAPRSYGSRPSGGSNIVILPGFGWGFGPFGYGAGGGGMGLFGGLMMVTVLGLGAFMVVQAIRRSRAQREGFHGEGDYEDEVVVAPGRAYVYKVQLGLGRSARGLQDRLAKFAENDTSSEGGLGQLLQQTALELLREKASIRYAGAEAHGPMSLTNGETKMNALALGERSRFQVERVRGADGRVRKSEAAQAESDEVLEYILVTLVVATRTPLASLKAVSDREQVDEILAELGGVSPDGLLGLEVIWTPADPTDAMTENDLMTSYPDLRSV